MRQQRTELEDVEIQHDALLARDLVDHSVPGQPNDCGDGDPDRTSHGADGRCFGQEDHTNVGTAGTPGAVGSRRASHP
jgi:hypothetical protein